MKKQYRVYSIEYIVKKREKEVESYAAIRLKKSI